MIGGLAGYIGGWVDEIFMRLISFAMAMLAEAALSYLGLGVQPPHPSWGRMLRESQSYLTSAPWYTYAPGVSITLMVLGFYMLSNAIRDILDPREN